VALGYTDKCVIQGMPADQVGVFEASSVPTDFVFGGNPALEPEAADTLTLGLVIQPLRYENWQFSVDYFEIEVTDSIGEIDPVDICFDARNTANLFCDNITRDPALGYNVVEVFAPQSNRGRISSRGIDTQVEFRSPLPDSLAWFGSAADFGFDLFWTHTLENSWQLNPVTGVIECTGLFGDFCPIMRIGQGATMPENRISAQLSYITDKLGIHLFPRWIEGTANSEIARAEFLGRPPPLLAVPSVGNRLYLDLGVRYDIMDGVYARFGVNNLTDTNAPLMPDVNNNTDAVLYDVLGRSYFLSISAQLIR
jgi:outer membrane receptor protein involved in Fe transport